MEAYCVCNLLVVVVCCSVGDQIQGPKLACWIIYSRASWLSVGLMTMQSLGSEPCPDSMKWLTTAHTQNKAERIFSRFPFKSGKNIFSRTPPKHPLKSWWLQACSISRQNRKWLSTYLPTNLLLSLLMPVVVYCLLHFLGERIRACLAMSRVDLNLHRKEEWKSSCLRL